LSVQNVCGEGGGPAAFAACAGRGAGYDYIFPRADWEAENTRPAKIIFFEGGAARRGPRAKSAKRVKNS
jgi:hypothetical protein